MSPVFGIFIYVLVSLVPSESMCIVFSQGLLYHMWEREIRHRRRWWWLPTTSRLLKRKWVLAVRSWLISSLFLVNELILSFSICPLISSTDFWMMWTHTVTFLEKDSEKKGLLYSPVCPPGMMPLLWLVFWSTLPPLVLLCGSDCCLVHESSSSHNGTSPKYSPPGTIKTV